MSDFLRYLSCKEKISAIRELRTLTGLGLTEAKKAVEIIMDGPKEPLGFEVFTKNDSDYQWSRYLFTDRTSAMSFAREETSLGHDVVVAARIAQSRRQPTLVEE